MDTLFRALRIYDDMVRKDSENVRPLYRPRDWNVVARHKEKENKKQAGAELCQAQYSLS